MYKNWLTSPTTLPSICEQSTSSLYFNQRMNISTNLMTTSPDVILEVGTSPNIRFVAHSSLLSMHSGYLRSALRACENNEIRNSEPTSIYLTNVTPEQFSPILTYMYTGYLELTNENIFPILLATHILHMPRALEICRSYLSQSQAADEILNENVSEFNKKLFDINNPEQLKNSKIVRPIPSKPLVSNIRFIMPPVQNISLPSNHTQFHSLNNYSIESFLKEKTYVKNNRTPSSYKETESNKFESRNPDISNFTNISAHSTSLANVRETLKSHSDDKIKMLKDQSIKLDRTKSSTSNSLENTDIKGNYCEKDTENENKTIVDVASCDGPVRFKRILNKAYGRNPESVHIPIRGRSNESVSLSFHQQMAKNICQQRYREKMSEEMENNEDDKNNLIKNISNNNGETFNCHYCNHTFKSQYCYQKHAKRHLNPVSIEHTKETSNEKTIITSKVHKIRKSNDKLQILDNTTNQNNLINITTEDKNEHSCEKHDIFCDTDNISQDGSKREVRPLDMNVQYYPCKTCGSKFPSYYFVHKHRKLCHSATD